MKSKPTIAIPILLIAVFGLTAVFNLLPPEIFGMNDNPYLSVVIVQLIVFATPTLIFCTLKGTSYTSRLRVRLPSPQTIILMLTAIALMVSGSGIIDYFMSLIAPAEMAASAASEYAAFAMNSGVFDGLYLVLAFALLPALIEEFLFRGVVLTEYTALSIPCAVVMSSLMFAMAHFSIYRLPSYFFCGVVLAIVTYATKSVVAAMVVHAVYNVIVLFFESYILYLAEKQNISAMLFVIILALVAILMAAVFAFECSAIYKGYAEENAPSDYLPRKKRGFFSSLNASMFSPTFIFLVVLYIVIIVFVV